LRSSPYAGINSINQDIQAYVILFNSTRVLKHCQRISAITCTAAKHQKMFSCAKHLSIGYFRSAYSRCRPVQGHTDLTDGSQKHIQNRKHHVPPKR